MSGQSSAVRAALVIAAGWLFFFWLGHPLPFVDDLRFVGASINLVHGGAFDNIYCPALKLVDPYPEFFAYMPLHGYAIAGWLKIFGISRVSFATFQCLMAFLATFALWLAMRRVSDSIFLPVGLVLVVEVFLNSTGLRPEAMGLALLAWGWVMLEIASPLAWFAGGLFLGATVFTSPNIGSFAPVVFFWVFVRSFKGKSGREIVVELVALAVGGVVAFLLFLAAIHGNLWRFLAMMKATRDQSGDFMNPGLIESLTAHPVQWRDAARAFLQECCPLLMLLVATAVMVLGGNWLERKPQRLTIVFLWIGAGILMVPMFSSAAGKVPMAFYAIVVCLAVATAFRATWLGPALGVWLVLFVVFLFGFGHRTLQLMGRPGLPEAQAAAVREHAAKFAPAPIYIDEFALAAIYDYRVPPNGLDYHFGLKDRITEFAPKQFPSGAALVISKETLVRVNAWGDFHLGPSPRLMPVIGGFFKLKLYNPYEIVVIQGGPETAREK
jgi:hypothetical protein